MANKVEIARIDLMTAIVKSIIQELGPKDFVSVLNNASYHGEAFIKKNFSDYLDDDDVFLGNWYAGIEQMQKAMLVLNKCRKP